MRWFVLSLVFLAPALQAWNRFAPGLPILGGIPQLGVTLYFPAAIYALPAWSRAPISSLPKSPWLLLAVGFAGLSLCWTEPGEIGRGVLICCGLFLPIPISCLVAETERLRSSALLLVSGSLWQLLLIVNASAGDFTRLGQISAGGVSSNANDFGSAMGLAVLILLTCVLPFVSSHRMTKHVTMLVSTSVIALCGVFGAALLLSGSRGAILAVAAGVGTSWLLHRLTLGRLMCTLALGTGLVVALFLDLPVIGVAMDRFLSRGNLASAGDRWWIWEGAWAAYRDHWSHGVGIGGVDACLGRYAHVYEGSVLGQDGITRIFSHNSYLEWMLGTGTIGTILAGCALWRLGSHSFAGDRRRQQTFRTSMLMFLLTLSLTNTAYRMAFFVPMASLLLAASISRRGSVAGVAKPAARPSLPMRRAA